MFMADRISGKIGELENAGGIWRSNGSATKTVYGRRAERGSGVPTTARCGLSGAYPEGMRGFIWTWPDRGWSS